MSSSRTGAGEQPHPRLARLRPELDRPLRLGDGRVEVFELIVGDPHQIEAEWIRILDVEQPAIQPIDRLAPLLLRRVELRDVEPHPGFVPDRQHLLFQKLHEVLDRLFGVVRPVGDVREHPVDERSLVGVESF